MFGDNVVRAFEETKDLFDPGNKMNPGKIVRPFRNIDNLRLGTGYRYELGRQRPSRTQRATSATRLRQSLCRRGQMPQREVRRDVPQLPRDRRERSSARQILAAVRDAAGRRDHRRLAVDRVRDALDLYPGVQRLPVEFAPSMSTYVQSRIPASPLRTAAATDVAPVRWVGCRCSPELPRPLLGRSMP